MPKSGGGLGQFADLREDLARKRWESLIPLYTLLIRSLEATINKCSIIGGVMPMLVVSEVLLKILNKIQVVVS